MLLVAAAALSVAGCDLVGRGAPSVDGYWKGQIFDESITEPASSPIGRDNERPRRIVLRLEESAGIVQGQFAKTSDVIAFRRMGESSSRHLSAYAVTGTLDSKRVRLRFSGDTGRTYEVDALLDNRMMAGSYVARWSTDGIVVTSSGRFEVERY